MKLKLINLTLLSTMLLASCGAATSSSSDDNSGDPGMDWDETSKLTNCSMPLLEGYHGEDIHDDHDHFSVGTFHDGHNHDGIVSSFVKPYLALNDKDTSNSEVFEEFIANNGEQWMFSTCDDGKEDWFQLKSRIGKISYNIIRYNGVAGEVQFGVPNSNGELHHGWDDSNLNNAIIQNVDFSGPMAIDAGFDDGNRHANTVILSPTTNTTISNATAHAEYEDYMAKIYEIMNVQNLNATNDLFTYDLKILTPHIAKTNEELFEESYSVYQSDITRGYAKHLVTPGSYFGGTLIAEGETHYLDSVIAHHALEGYSDLLMDDGSHVDHLITAPITMDPTLTNPYAANGRYDTDIMSITAREATHNDHLSITTTWYNKGAPTNLPIARTRGYGAAISVMSHEVIHAYGIGAHANGFRNEGQTAYNNFITNPATGAPASLDYGDPFSHMGYGQDQIFSSAVHRHYLGTQAPAHYTETSGTFNIPASGFAVVKGHLSNDWANFDNFYIEYQQLTNDGYNYTDASQVVVRYSDGGYQESNRVLHSSTNINGVSGVVGNGALQEGASNWMCSQNGSKYTFTLNSTSGGNANVSVDIDSSASNGCVK